MVGEEGDGDERAGERVMEKREEGKLAVLI